MLDSLLEKVGVHRSGMVLGICSNVVKALENEFKDDADAKKHVIDSIIALLEKQKN